VRPPEGVVASYGGGPLSALSDLVFGLTTAFGYGSGDFLARNAAHRIGHLRVLFFMELTSLFVLLPIAFAFERDRWLAGSPWLLLVILGTINLFASMFLYRSFEYGVLSIVSPLVSSYPAVTAGLAIVFLGDRPSYLATAGIAAVLVGILLLSRSRAHPENPPPRNARVGFVSAFLAFAGYGVFYFALAYVVDAVGPVSSAAFVRVVAVAILLAASGIGVTTIGRPARDILRVLAVVGVLDSIAFVAYNVGIRAGSVAIVGTLSGLFSAVTVALAAAFLHERLSRPQYAGVVSVFFGVVLMAVS